MGLLLLLHRVEGDRRVGLQNVCIFGDYAGINDGDNEHDGDENDDDDQLVMIVVPLMPSMWTPQVRIHQC